MFNKKKNFRRKVSDSEQEDGEPEQGAGSGVRVKDKHKVKESKPRAPSLLSFGGDAEEETDAMAGGVKLKKEKKKGMVPSHRALGGLPKAGGEKLAVGLLPAAGEYTAERLAELKSGLRTIPGGFVKEPEPIMVLKGGFKPAELGEKEGPPKAKNQAVVTGTSAGGLEDLTSGLGKGLSYIPDEEMIRAAKLKREKLRQAQAAPDYVPLASGGRGDRLDKLTDSAPPERKEDAESSEDEGEVRTRMTFLGDVKKSGGGPEKGVFDVGEKQEAEHDDEEEDRWEMEQMRKAVKAVKAKDEKKAQGGVASGWGDLLQRRNILSVANQGESAIKSLRETLLKMKESESRARAALRQNEERIQGAEESVKELERGLSASSERYVYVQKLRDYIAELCDCLRDKGALIEELEEQMQRLQEERASALAERRAADVSAEVGESEAATSAAMTALGRGAGALAASAAAAEAAARFRDGLALTPQLDEFGRDMNLQKRMEAQRRAEARARRRARVQARRTERTAQRASHTNGNENGNGIVSEERLDGETSSSESEDEVSAFEKGRGELVLAAEAVFRDADEEFRSLSKVKGQLEEWKKKYPAAYRDAYASMSAPALFAPYVKLELLRWDPLHGEAGFDGMGWYQQLFDYGMGNANGGEPDPDDADANMVPTIVEKVALPLLLHLITHCWDLQSTKRTVRIAAAVSEVQIYVPPESEPVRDLVSAVRTRIAVVVEKLVVPAWTPALLAAAPQAVAVSAEYFGAAVRVLRNIVLWRDILPAGDIEALALDHLVAAKLIPHLRTLLTTPSDAILRTGRLVAALGGAFTKGGEGFTAKLAPLVEFLDVLGRALEGRKAAGAAFEDTLIQAERLRRLFVELGARDKARRLAKSFGLKEEK